MPKKKTAVREFKSCRYDRYGLDNKHACIMCAIETFKSGVDGSGSRIRWATYGFENASIDEVVEWFRDKYDDYGSFERSDWEGYYTWHADRLRSRPTDRYMFDHYVLTITEIAD